MKRSRIIGLVGAPRGAHAPLDVGGETIRVDTTKDVDLDAVVERLGALLYVCCPVSESDRPRVARTRSESTRYCS